MLAHLSGIWDNFASALELAYSSEPDTLDKPKRVRTHCLFDGMLSI